MSRRTLGSVLFLVVAVLVPVAVVVVLVVRTDDGSSLPEVDDVDLRNGRVFIQDNLWSTEHDQYAVWVGPDGAPLVGKRARDGGEWQVEDLSALSGNPLAAPTADDEHNVFVIAVDGRGYVHVMGNMHNDALRYVRSRRPGDITSWEAGAVGAPAVDVTYPRVVALPDGTLLFWRREGVAGHGATIVDHLDPTSDTWAHMGTVLDGSPSGESPYVHDVAVDPESGAVHLLFEWRTDGEVATTNDVEYARSDDGGRTWTTSDGTPLATPITHGTAEAVLDTAPEGSGLLNDGGLAVDADGNPHGAVVLDEGPAGRKIVHVWHDGDEWRREEIDGSVIGWRPAVVGTPDGEVWLIGTRDDVMVAVDVTEGGAGATRELAVVRPGWEANTDGQALARFGVVELLVPDGSDPLVVVASR